MKLAAITKVDSSTAFKVTALAGLLAVVPNFVYRFILPGQLTPEMPAYFFSLLGLGYAVLRFEKTPFWLNTLLTVLVTFVAVCIGGLASIYF